MKIIYCDIEMIVDYYFEKGETQTYDYPGSPDMVEIEKVEVNNVDIYDLLDQEQLNDLETIILNKLQ